MICYTIIKNLNKIQIYKYNIKIFFLNLKSFFTLALPSKKPNLWQKLNALSIVKRLYVPVSPSK